MIKIFSRLLNVIKFYENSFAVIQPLIFFFSKNATPMIQSLTVIDQEKNIIYEL